MKKIIVFGILLAGVVTIFFSCKGLVTPPIISPAGVVWEQTKRYTEGDEASGDTFPVEASGFIIHYYEYFSSDGKVYYVERSIPTDNAATKWEKHSGAPYTVTENILNITSLSWPKPETWVINGDILTLTHKQDDGKNFIQKYKRITGPLAEEIINLKVGNTP